MTSWAPESTPSGTARWSASATGCPNRCPARTRPGWRSTSTAVTTSWQDLGNGNFAFYAHLKTGTVKVRPGDRLAAGQVIANVGNSGNSSAPHLHFHVMSTPDPLRSDGLPFVLDEFGLDGRLLKTDDVDDIDGIFAGEPVPLQRGFAPRNESDVMPMELDVMTYADQ